jgi:serine/threonine-protein kinase
VKPANILLRRDGVAKLADLGIATAAERTSITQSNIVLGTASYMAPEQLAGDRAGPAADIYALAAVAFEALSGRKAREGTTPLEVAHHVVNGPEPDLRAAWSKAPAAAATILARGMEREPERRPPSAGRLAADLERAVRLGDTKPATGATATTALAADGQSAHLRRAAPDRPSRTGRLAPALAALAVVLVAAVAGVAALGGGDGDDAPDVASQRQAADGRGDGGARGEPQRATEGVERDREPAPQAVVPEEEAPSSDPSEPAPEPAGDPVELNDRGYALMQAGDYESAIPLLEQAVAAYPEGSGELTYAYALYNLGRSLRLAGRPDEAVPILERRLRIPNQTETVQRELDLALAAS